MTRKRTRKSPPEKSENEESSSSNSKSVDELEDLPGIFSTLTPDIFLEILTLLPIKSLCTCKYVCKSLHNLILHPNFAKFHFSKSLQNQISPNVLIYDKSKTFYLIDHQVFDETKTWINNPTNIALKVFDQMFERKEFGIVGSVNGLVCFSPSHRKDYFTPLPYYVCNPITREYVVLPKSNKSKRRPVFSGFGFDERSNEYKVVRILQTKVSLKAEAEVFTLGVKGWRQITNVPYLYNTHSNNVLLTGSLNVFVGGSLHWITHELTKPLGIVSFVVSSEEFHVIPPPSNVDSEQKNVVYYLGVLGGCLCFAEYNVGVVTGYNKVWVMKEYGVHGSWVNEYSFRREVMPSPFKCHCRLTKLGNGEFLLQYEGKNLGYYNPESETFRHIMLQNIPRFGYAQVDIHVGSLFSPPKTR